MISKILMGAGAAALLASGAMAQDSTFGTTSTDTVNITAEVAPVVRVSGLDDVNFDLNEAFFNQSGPNTYKNQMFCVYSNVSNAGSFSISATGTPAPAFGSNAWAVTNSGDGSILAFTMKVYDGSLDRVVGPGDNWSGFSSAQWNGDRPDTGDCSDTGDNTRLQVTFSKDNVLGANAGTYAGAITLVASAT
ncbi:hypothetical protein [Hyphomonas beringensis]|nr:hypothetical protein [Hyphomonas beringensis]